MGRMPSAPSRRLGTWKIAYADFLTALMAFFLVMWLVSGVSGDDRDELAEYFGGSKVVSTTDVAMLTAADLQAAQIRAALAPAMDEGHLSVMVEGGSIRLELMDRTSDPLFRSGQGGFNDNGEKLLRSVAELVAGLEAPIALEGHTDAFPSAVAGYSNWELSADRANAARRILEQSGVQADRITGVSGLAHTRPLNPGEPHLPANRRVSILLQLAG